MKETIRMNRNKLRRFINEILGMIILVLIDQFTKYAAVVNLKGRQSIVLVKGVLELSYLENRGAAFGMLQNQKIFFVFIAVLIIAVIGYVLSRVPENRKYFMLHLTLVFIASGAVGNLVDRLRLDYVVDFISFVLINFPIFNVADIYVTVATAILIIMLLFVYDEHDLNFLSLKTKRFRNVK